MQTLFTLFFSFLCAWGCYHFAKQRGLNPRIWGIAGLFLGILAFIALFLFPKRQVRPLHPKEPLPFSPPNLTILKTDHVGKLWYFIDTEKRQLGPMSFEALNTAWREGKVTEKTFVWNEAMENWHPLKEVLKAPTQSLSS